MAAKKESAAPKRASKAKKEAAPKAEAGPMQLTWALDELPSAQHKTGLVGLLLLLRWLLGVGKRRRRGVVRIVTLDSAKLTVEFDQEGLTWLFDEAYAAESIETERDTAFKDVEPLRVVEREQVDSKKVDKKSGKPVVKKVKKFVYPIVQPQGALLVENDPKGNDGAWIKLWRDFVWGVLRAVPATRAPYNARAAKEDAGDAEALWHALARGGERSIELPSTYFVGAQAVTAENVAFRDRERFQFLLHFWPFAVGIAVPTTMDREGKSRFVGFALSFPDVADLQLFAEEYERVLANRTADVAAYLPRQAVLDLPAEGGLQFLHSLRERLKVAESKKLTSDLVFGVDVFHLEREGNNVRTRSFARIEPTEVQQDEYERIRASFRDPLFRRQLLQNLIERREWTSGFDRLFSTMPSTHFLRGPREPGAWPSSFPTDVKTQLSRFAETQGDAA
jgi:CRISPR-associated protein Cmx8